MAESAPVVRVTEPGRAPVDHVLHERLLIGRNPENDVILVDPKVSGRHARLELEDGVVMIEDLGSLNRTRIAGGPALAHGDRAPLGPGGRAFLGRTTLLLLGDEDEAEPLADDHTALLESPGSFDSTEDVTLVTPSDPPPATP